MSAKTFPVAACMTFFEPSSGLTVVTSAPFPTLPSESPIYQMVKSAKEAGTLQYVGCTFVHTETGDELSEDDVDRLVAEYDFDEEEAN